MLTFGKTCSCTGGSDSLVNNFGVTERRNDFFGEALTAVIADICFESTIKTSRLFFNYYRKFRMQTMRTEYRLRFNIHIRSRGNTIRNTVSVDVKSFEDVLFGSVGIVLDIGHADNLRGLEYSAICQSAIGSIEICKYPIVSVNHLVPRVPTGIVFIPVLSFNSGRFDENVDIGYRLAGIIVKVVGVNLYPICKNDIFQGHRKVRNISAKIINDSIGHFCYNKSFEVCE